MSVPVIRQYNATLTDNRIIPAQYVNEAGKTVLIGLINPLWWVLAPVSEQQGDEWGNQDDNIDFNVDFNVDNIVNVNVPAIPISIPKINIPEIVLPHIDISLPDFSALMSNIVLDFPGISSIVDGVKQVISNVFQNIPGIGGIIGSIVNVFKSIFSSPPEVPVDQRPYFINSMNLMKSKLNNFIQEGIARGILIKRAESCKMYEEDLWI